MIASRAPLRTQCLRAPATTAVRSVMFFRGKTAPLPETHTAQMKRRIDSPDERERYGQRFGTVEPVFGNVCYNKGLDRFTLLPLLRFCVRTTPHRLFVQEVFPGPSWLVFPSPRRLDPRGRRISGSWQCGHTLGSSPVHSFTRSYHGRSFAFVPAFSDGRFPSSSRQRWSLVSTLRPASTP